MTKSLKQDQLDLLRFEKQLLGLGAGLGALAGGAAANAANLVGGVAESHTDNVREAYMNLVETVQAAHNAIEESAITSGIQLLQARGTPKTDPPALVEAAKSILGLG